MYGDKELKSLIIHYIMLLDKTISGNELIGLTYSQLVEVYIKVLGIDLETFNELIQSAIDHNMDDDEKSRMTKSEQIISSGALHPSNLIVGFVDFEIFFLYKQYCDVKKKKMDLETEKKEVDDELADLENRIKTAKMWYEKKGLQEDCSDLIKRSYQISEILTQLEKVCLQAENFYKSALDEHRNEGRK